MAEILPFKAWRYDQRVGGKIGDLVSPLFDVVSEKQREHLYQNPLNSIHLSVPQGEEPFEGAKKRFEDWVSREVLKQDPINGIYPYFQVFSLPGKEREFTRKGFICLVNISEEKDSVLLHENTIPKAVNDRMELLRTTKMNMSATHGLYNDPEFILESLLDEAIAQPLFETEDYQGVKDVLSVIQDEGVIEKFKSALSKQKIILADGHHRFQSSKEYQRECKESNPSHTGKELYNYHLMYLTNGESKDLRILPTHRLIQGIESFADENVITALSNDFIIKEIDEVYDVPDIIAGKKHAFGLIFKDRCFKIRLKEGHEQEINWKFPDSIKTLDLTILHYFIIEKALGILGKDQRKDEHVSFERNFATCLESVHMGDSQMAVITNEISMEEVREVCHSGYTMPQKSTYFYPKTVAGFVFASIED